MVNYMIDEKFWLAISFVIFVLLVYKPIKNALLKFLDSEINKIKNDITDAIKLKSEATDLNNHFTTLLAEAHQNYNKIISESKEQNQKLWDDSKKELDLLIYRKEQEIAQKISSLEINAVSEIENEMKKQAEKLAKEYLEKNIKTLPNDITIAKRLLAS